MTISKEQIESASILLNTDGQFFGEPCKIVFMTSEQLETIRTVLQERLEFENRHNDVCELVLPKQPSEALAALETLKTITVNAALNTGHLTAAKGLSDQFDFVMAALQRKDVPHGFVLVPIEPTEEMIKATIKQDYADFRVFNAMKEIYMEVYKAMLSAAPKPTGE